MGGGADVVMRRLLALAVAAWVARWAAMELAAYAGRHWLPRGPAPKDSPRQPGRMPGPFDEPGVRPRDSAPRDMTGV